MSKYYYYQEADFQPKIKDHVQLNDTKIRTGVVIALHSAKKFLSKKDEQQWFSFSDEEKIARLPTATVKWDDDATESIIPTQLLERPDSPLEKDFRLNVLYSQDLIQDQIKLAEQALQKAIDISEKLGVPFYSSISPLGQHFVPKSFNTKFKMLDNNVIENISGMYINDYDVGWQHSAVC